MHPQHFPKQSVGREPANPFPYYIDKVILVCVACDD